MENKNTSVQRYENRENEFYGLIKSFKYSFDEFGFVNWRNLIPKEYLFPNIEKINQLGKNISTNIDELDDSLILVKLSGIKWLARIRGYESVEFDVQIINENVIAKCSIHWIANFENQNGALYQEVASCNIKNSDDFSLKFAETIACNRAFVRCVRNFLNINIVGEEEIDKKIKNNQTYPQEETKQPQAITPQSIFIKICKTKNMNFDDIINFVNNNEEGFDSSEIKNETDLVKNLTSKSAKKLMKAIKSS